MSIKVLIIEVVGLVLFCSDQISDIIILVQGDFYNLQIKILMYFFFFLNIFIVFVWYAVKNITYTNYFVYQPQPEQSNHKRQVILDKIFLKISFYMTFILNGLTAIFWYAILTLIQILILWFGFYKLYRVHSNIAKKLSNFLFLTEQNEWLNNAVPNTVKTEIEEISKEKNIQEKFNEEMKIMCFKLDLVEKILENLPQLILQLINISLQGGEITKIQMFSIAFAILDIIYNIIIAFSYKSEELKQNIERITEEVKNIFKRIPYLEIILIIQSIFYIVITISYKWEDYIDFKDKETNGKDVHDSIRSFIIIFPLPWLVSAYICLLAIFQKDGPENKVINLLLPIFFKNAAAVQVCYDLIIVKTPPFEYGQSIMMSSYNMTIFIIIIFASVLFEEFTFYQINKDKRFLTFIAKTLIMAYMITEVKMVSYWVNVVHYYDWTSLDDKNPIIEMKNEGLSCNHNLERTLRGYIISYVLFQIGKYIFFIVIMIKLNGNKKLINVIFWNIVICLPHLVIEVCYLAFRSSYEFCDILVFAHKEENALFSLNIIFYFLTPLFILLIEIQFS